MSHFAELDKDNIVIRVLVGDNNMPNEGYDWFVETFGGRWIQTSYNANIRKNYANLGFSYDEARDAFIAPRTFKSWTLDEETCQWQAPTPYPLDGLNYYWEEKLLEWVLVEIK